MYAQNYARAYRSNSILTASPGQLVLMLFDGALNAMAIARAACDDPSGDPRRFEIIHTQLTKAQQIIAELRQKAQDEADRIAVREQSRREAERQQIVSQLRGEVGQIAVDLAGKIVGESLDDEARQRRIVERFIADLEAGESGGPDGQLPSGGDPVVAG